MTKEELAKAYADWYAHQQMERSGCGGPVLMACVIMALVMYYLI